jgi:hypothetical protein
MREKLRGFVECKFKENLEIQTEPIINVPAAQ